MIIDMDFYINGKNQLLHREELIYIKNIFRLLYILSSVHIQML